MSKKPTFTETVEMYDESRTITATALDGRRQYGARYLVEVDGISVGMATWSGGRRYWIANDGTQGWEYITGDNGSVADVARHLAYGWAGDLEAAKREAAKSPEQIAQEQAQRDAVANEARNRIIVKDAEALLATLDRLVPDSTIHYAVEEARRSLKVLVREASKASIKTEVA